MSHTRQGPLCIVRKSSKDADSHPGFVDREASACNQLKFNSKQKTDAPSVVANILRLLDRLRM